MINDVSALVHDDLLLSVSMFSGLFVCLFVVGFLFGVCAMAFSVVMSSRFRTCITYCWRLAEEA